jgi:hypothetical protein
MPAVQTWSERHRLPTMPQLFGSVAVETHPPPVIIVPGGHAQLPAVHVIPLKQRLPHMPQLRGSV